MSKPPSKPRKGQKGAKTAEGSPTTAEAREVALPGQQRPVHSRARAKLAAVCKRLEGGTPINHACALEGVPRQNLYDLIAADEDAALDVAKARATGAEAYRSSLVLIAEGNAAERANANVLLHLMERLYPDDYAPAPKQLALSGPGGAPIKQEVVVTDTVDKLSDEEVLRAARALLKGG